MKKIFWGIQSLNGLGGTETVSIKLMNLLAGYFEIHLICSAKIEGDISYKIDPRIIVHSLNIPLKVLRFDETFLELKKSHHFLKILKLFHQELYEFFYTKNKKRKYIKSLMDSNSIYIGSALDSYLFAPKKVKVFYHFHFDAKQYFSFANRFGFCFSRKPDKTIFLAKSIEEKVLKKKKELLGKTTYIYNPIKFRPIFSDKLNNNSLIFVGRFSKQKDPMFALKIAKNLHDKNFKFSLKMYGEGNFYNEMVEFKNKNKLDEVEIILHHIVTQDDFVSSDLLLFTSIYEGFPLVIGEANASSCPVISTNWYGTINESIINKTNGFILDSKNEEDYGNKIIEVLTNKEELIKLKKSSFEYSKRLDDEAILKEWLDILK